MSTGYSDLPRLSLWLRRVSLPFAKDMATASLKRQEAFEAYSWFANELWSTMLQSPQWITIPVWKHWVSQYCEMPVSATISLLLQPRRIKPSESECTQVPIPHSLRSSHCINFRNSTWTSKIVYKSSRIHHDLYLWLRWHLIKQQLNLMKS